MTVCCVSILVCCGVKWACCVFFFFKQKTAYEMRISDWSSDVCSSDLIAGHLAGDQRDLQTRHGACRGISVTCGPVQGAAFAGAAFALFFAFHCLIAFSVLATCWLGSSALYS